jgi:Phytanoyl-CoA dioxygenase (PhyH)
MFNLRRKSSRSDGGGTAVAEPPSRSFEFSGNDDELFAEIERRSEANRTSRSHENEQELIRLRHIGGIRRMDAADPTPEFVAPDTAALPSGPGLPEIDGKDVTAGLLRAGILRDGCLLIRGLVNREQALAMADGIDRGFAERERILAEESGDDDYYEEFGPHPRFNQDVGRPWVREGGGLLASDSPLLSFQMTELFREGRIPQLASEYLGQPALSSLQKTTLRKAAPEVGGAWHQDGKFMGPVRALNLWLSLSRCGDIAPGLDIVPRRIDDYVTTLTDEAVFEMQVSNAKAQEAAGEVGIIRPIFEPGDALFFDELFLHATGSDPSMPNPRFAIESWFFGGSAFPADYAPIAV